MSEIQRGDVLQIVDDKHHWYPALVIVDEVKSFGCQAYMIHVTSNRTDKPNPLAYIRLKDIEYEKIGEAVILAGSGERGHEPAEP